MQNIIYICLFTIPICLFVLGDPDCDLFTNLYNVR